MMYITSTEARYVAADSTQQKAIQNIGENPVYYKNAEDVDTGDTKLEPHEAVTATEGLYFVADTGKLGVISIRSLSLREELEAQQGNAQAGVVEFTDVEEDYTIQSTDLGKTIRVSDESAAEQSTTVTVPDAFDIGFHVTVMRGETEKASPSVKLKAAEGVSLVQEGGTEETLSFTTLFSAYRLVKQTGDTWKVELVP